MPKLRTLPLLLALGLAAGACTEEEPSLDEVRGKSISLTTTMVRDFGHSLEALQGIESIQALFDGLLPVDSLIQRATGDDDEVTPLPMPVPAQAEEGEDGGSEGPGADEVADELHRILEEYLFADENLEDQGEDWALFRVKAATVCPKLRDEALADCASIDWQCDEYPFAECEQWQADELQWCTEGAQEDHAECMQKLDAVELRIKVKLLDDGDSVDIEILVGPGRANPVDLRLRSDSIAADFDLAAIEAAIEHISNVLGEEAPMFPEQFQGVVGVSVTRSGEQDFTFAAAIKAALLIAGSYNEQGPTSCTSGSDGEVVCEEPVVTVRHLSFSSAAADPLVSMRIQAAIEQVTLAVDLGRTLVTLPFAELFDYGNPTGDFVVELAGLDGELTLTEGVEALVIRGLGLGDGDSSIRHDDTPILSLSLNADLDRAFDQVTSLVDGWPVLDFDPGAVLDVYVNFGHLNAYLDPSYEEPAPSFLCDQTYSLSLLADANGAARVTPFAAQLGSINGDGIQVLAGSLSLASSAAPADTVSVDAGMCLFASDTVAGGAHELLGHFYAATCE